MKIKPYEKNAKIHTGKQLELLARIVAEIGWRQSVEVNQQGVIVVGHGRYLAWEQYKDKYKLPDIWVVDDTGKTIMGKHDEKPLTEQQEKMWRLADNQVNAMTGLDMKLAIPELKLLDDEMIDLTGFDKDLIIESEAKDDEVPEVPEEPKSKLGDLYELGNHRVLCGDSTKEEDVERLMDGKKADMVFTDPPYGMNLDTDYSKLPGTHSKYSKVIGDDVEFDISFLFDILPSPVYYIWGADYLYNTIPNFKKGSMVVWAKRQSEEENKVFGSAYELCWVYPKIKKEIWFIRGINQSAERLGEHPTQKPTELGTRAIKDRTQPDDIVADLFLGSGSTLIACDKTNRICYGIELDPKYIDVIVQRYVDYTGNNKIKKNGEEIVW
ncbi:DNA methyltransferase [Methanoculleus sp.]|uniref:DNA modification methylase n=1 Tax=Methanoculleus sp. TaxID=90427 RepID=UPI0025E512BB|nr:DNA methyltransferase [Methanoculleus sp.]MCK9319668.1 hypothetical protein [Methanoculleus sp.]